MFLSFVVKLRAAATLLLCKLSKDRVVSMRFPAVITVSSMAESACTITDLESIVADIKWKHKTFLGLTKLTCIITITVASTQ